MVTTSRKPRTTPGYKPHRAQEIADDLIGTARDLDEFATDEEINNYKFCCELDAIIFQCESCGWWCGVEEMTDDNICDDCYEGDE